MERRAVTVRGIVQGVGFRPYVYRLARQFHLAGSVRNESGAVCIEVEGTPESIDEFCGALVDLPPPLATVDDLSSVVVDCRGEVDFRIAESGTQHSPDVFVSPDVATCADCLRELFDPADRRYRYPFLNCTNCGPRLTIIRGAPYDRRQTTMAGFAMCRACQAEYDNPLDRRYHAQPTCCAHCGPSLELLTNRREPIVTSDAVVSFAEMVLGGKIGALKGLGGYHLVCDATDSAAVAQLRKLKERDDKPFAVMVASLEHAEQLCEFGPLERELLSSSARPIVLARRREGSGHGAQHKSIVEAVAPGNPYLGLVLPYTPAHHLLVEAANGTPLVMTSGNRADEPIAYEDSAAFEQLGDIVDIFLVHNRPIHVRCDDSVTRVIDKHESPIRRSRGYAPRPMRLPQRAPCPMLAVGGQLKATFALARERSAIVSHHLGDLDDHRAYRAFERDITLYEQLFASRPRVIVHDFHPDYASTRYAERRATAEGIETIAVQHHHAHVAACMAEHGLEGETIGVAFDGTGFGMDGTIWGGEFLVANYATFERAAHLRAIPLPGGDQAVRQPWRAALSHALDADCDVDAIDVFAGRPGSRVAQQMIERRFNSPPTTSAGRLFDAVAAITGLRDRVTFEGQAAMELEWLATAEPPCGSYPYAIERLASPRETSCLEIDTRPMVRAVVEDVSRAVDRRRIARRFHATLVDLIANVCDHIRGTSGVERVVLTGGVFMNTLLTLETTERLAHEGFDVFRHERVPPNDGGISLGQLAVAAARLKCSSADPPRESANSFRQATSMPLQ